MDIDRPSLNTCSAGSSVRRQLIWMAVFIAMEWICPIRNRQLLIELDQRLSGKESQPEHGFTSCAKREAGLPSERAPASGSW